MEKRYIEPATHLADETPWNLVEADFTKLSGECGFLSYSYFDATGQSISPPKGVFWERFFQRIKRRNPGLETPSYFQTQVWAATSRPLDDETKQAVRELFVHCREKFREYFAAGGNSGRDMASEDESRSSKNGT